MRLFNAHGRIDIAEKQGKPQKKKEKIKKEEIAICLNCKKPKCNGNCEKVKKGLHRKEKNKNREGKTNEGAK